jgi:hypothetical protein
MSQGADRMRIVSAWRAALARHPMLLYVQIIPVALILWGTDVLDRFRAGAATAGLHNATAVVVISRQLGGEFAAGWSSWLASHPLPAMASAWYYIVLHGAVAGLVGIALLWRREPSFPLHRNALIAANVVGLLVFLTYPVAPPRMLSGFHDITASAVPVFSGMLEGKAASEFASLPSLHVVWALWAAVAATVLLRRHRVLRVLVWLYPAATILDVLATANHYLLDVLLAPGVLVLAYAIAWAIAAARRGLLRDQLIPELSRAAAGLGTVVTGLTAARQALVQAVPDLISVLHAPLSKPDPARDRHLGPPRRP